MTNLERDIKNFLLKALLAARGEPMADATLKGAVVNAWRHVAFNGETLDDFLKDLARGGFVAGTDDPVEGLVWALTLKGTNRAQQLP